MRSGGFEGLGSFGAFLAVFGIMVGYFAAVVINFGDFSRFVSNEKEMKKGNLYGLVGNIVLFSFITLMITGGTIAVFGEYVAQPTDMVIYNFHQLPKLQLFFDLMAQYKLHSYF